MLKGSKKYKQEDLMDTWKQQEDLGQCEFKCSLSLFLESLTPYTSRPCPQIWLMT